MDCDGAEDEDVDEHGTMEEQDVRGDCSGDNMEGWIGHAEDDVGEHSSQEDEEVC